MIQLLIILGIVIIVIGGLSIVGYLVYRRGIRYAKGIERGIKMVPVLINLPPPSEDAEVGARDVRDVMQERISQAEVLYNLIASTATKGFKSKFFGQRHISFELVAIEGVIQFYAAVPVAMVAVIKQAILTAYPGANLEEVEDHNIFSQTGKISGTYGGEITLKHDYVYPIATFDQLKRDTIQGVINSLTSLEEGDGAGIQILLRPAREGWMKKAESLAKEKRENKDGSGGLSIKSVLQAPFKVPDSGGGDDEGGKPPKQLSNMEQTAADAIEEKAKSTGYEVLIRIIASSSTASRSQAVTNNIVSTFSLFDAPGLNGFKFEPAKNMERFVTDFIFRFFPPERNKMILNSVELSTLFHFPDAQFTQTSQVQRQYSKQVESPSQLSQEGLLVGYNVYHGVKKQIRLSDNDRRRHVYIVGQTGTGKSVLLENMMVQDMQAGKGFAFIDPHGDSAEDILGMIPQERSEDVIYFDPGAMEHPPGLNLFEYHTEDQKDFLIQEAINMLYRLYDPQRQGIIGPRYEHMFRNAALLVMADPNGGTFIDIPKLFRDPQFVKEKLKHVEDKTVQEFWQKEIPQAQRSSDFGEMMSWFVSKFGAFLSNQMMRNIIGQPQSSFDLREVMDSKKILIANLSKGRLGELNSMLLGMIFVMKFQAAAMSRANQPENERIDFSLYIDEFQNFSTESFAFILSEARKYHLNMVVANQYISQLSEEVREAVFGNVGTIISLRTGPNDADFLVKQFSPVFSERDLVNLPNYHAAIRLMNQGLPTQPFNLTTLPPLGESQPKLAQALKQLSNAKYGRPRQEVEDDIFERLSTKPPPNPYESLASSQESAAGKSSAGASSRSDGASSGGGEDSSFLDEWLAKRRQSMQQGGTPSQGGPSSSQEGTTGAPHERSQSGTSGPASSHGGGPADNARNQRGGGTMPSNQLNQNQHEPANEGNYTQSGSMGPNENAPASDTGQSPDNSTPASHQTDPQQPSSQPPVSGGAEGQSTPASAPAQQSPQSVASEEGQQTVPSSAPAEQTPHQSVPSQQPSEPGESATPGQSPSSQFSTSTGAGNVSPQTADSQQSQQQPAATGQQSPQSSEEQPLSEPAAQQTTPPSSSEGNNNTQTDAGTDASDQGSSNRNETVVQPLRSGTHSQEKHQALVNALYSEEAEDEQQQFSGDDQIQPESAVSTHQDPAPQSVTPSSVTEQPASAPATTGQNKETSQAMSGGVAENTETPPENGTDSPTVSQDDTPAGSDSAVGASGNGPVTDPGKMIAPDQSPSQGSGTQEYANQTKQQTPQSPATGDLQTASGQESSPSPDTDNTPSQEPGAATGDQETPPESADAQQFQPEIDEKQISQQVAGELGVELPQENSKQSGEEQQANATPASTGGSPEASSGTYQLKPGEIYIDEEGNVHQGSN